MRVERFPNEGGITPVRLLLARASNSSLGVEIDDTIHGLKVHKILPNSIVSLHGDFTVFEKEKKKKRKMVV